MLCDLTPRGGLTLWRSWDCGGGCLTPIHGVPNSLGRGLNPLHSVGLGRAAHARLKIEELHAPFPNVSLVTPEKFSVLAFTQQFLVLHLLNSSGSQVAMADGEEPTKDGSLRRSVLQENGTSSRTQSATDSENGNRTNQDDVDPRNPPSLAIETATPGQIGATHSSDTTRNGIRTLKILMVGMTGAGKSSFISTLLQPGDDDNMVGHDGDSCKFTFSCPPFLHTRFVFWPFPFPLPDRAVSVGPCLTPPSSKQGPRRANHTGYRTNTPSSNWSTPPVLTTPTEMSWKSWRISRPIFTA